MCMGQVVPLYGIYPALVHTIPGGQECNLRHQTFTSLQKEHPCIVSEYIRPELSLFKRNTTDLERYTSRIYPLVQGVKYRAEGLEMLLRLR